MADPGGGWGFGGWNPPFFTINAFEWEHVVGPFPPFQSCPGLGPPFLKWLDPPLYMPGFYEVKLKVKYLEGYGYMEM